MTNKRIAFIGGGNMATSLLGGLIADGCAPDSLVVAEPDADKRAALAARFGVRTVADNGAAVAGSATVVFAVKPQVMAEAVRELAQAIAAERPLVISIAAGVRVPDITRWLGFAAPVVRSMPNTPALVGSGATALFASAAVSEAQRNRAESILRAVGLTLWVPDEGMLDAVTALSGSGPAYFFLLMELMQKAGVALGLPADTARLLTMQTAFGAAKMALESPDEPAVLRARVTSKGGTTQAALEALEAGGIEALVRTALARARDRSVELGRMLGDS